MDNQFGKIMISLYNKDIYVYSYVGYLREVPVRLKLIEINT